MRVLLLGLLVAALDEGKDLLVRGVAAADKAAGVAVCDIVLGDLIGAVRHDLILHQILDLLHGRGAVHFLALQLHALGDTANLRRRHARALVHAFVRLGDR